MKSKRVNEIQENMREVINKYCIKERILIGYEKVNLFIIGAAKSGTTSLWAYFRNHPDVFTASDVLKKNLHTFLA